MTNEELALEFTKILAPTINSACSAREAIGVNCSQVYDYYDYFLESLNRRSENNAK